LGNTKNSTKKILFLKFCCIKKRYLCAFKAGFCSVWHMNEMFFDIMEDKAVQGNMYLLILGYGSLRE
jgi:hypothetical protein